jgi:oxidoreductase
MKQLRTRSNRKPRVRVAVIGTGWIAEKVYLPSLLNHPGIEVAAAYDPSAEMLARFSRHAGLGPAALGLEACWAPDIDAVLLCTPPSVHAQQIARFVARGKYVLCEKPVFRHTSELDQIGDASVVAKRLMGSASMRLRRDVRLLLQWITKGLIGPLEYVRLGWWREKGVPSAGSWRTDPQHAPMGVMEDLGPHLLDLLAYLVSKRIWNELHVTTATSRCRYGNDMQRSASWFNSELREPYVVPDQASATFVSNTGTKVEVEVCWANDLPGDYCSLWFQGRDGTASLKGLLGLSNLRRSSEQSCSLEIEGRSPEIHYFPVGPELQMQAFADSINVFAGFCKGVRGATSNYSEIELVTKWLTEIQQISQDVPATAAGMFSLKSSSLLNAGAAE